MIHTYLTYQPQLPQTLCEELFFAQMKGGGNIG